METTFLLIRHGNCEHVGKTLPGRARGVHLSPGGRAQAARLTDQLARVPIRALYSSPLERAQETAEPLARALGLSVRVRDAFTEVDYGEWTGHAIQELEPLPAWQQYNHFRSGNRIPGGEMMIEIQARVASELHRLRIAHPGEVVAIFSHADTIRAALTHCLGMSIDHMLRLEIAPASVSTVRVGDWGPVVVDMNVK